MNIIIKTSQIQFSKGSYDGIIVVYSGHGTKDTLILSDYYATVEHKNDVFYKYNTMDRTELECAFNGMHVRNKVNAMKFYFVDACRGNQDAMPIKGDDNEEKKYNDNEEWQSYGPGNVDKGYLNEELSHPNKNRIIFYPNTEPYQSYGTKTKGSLLINGLYETLIDEKNMNKSLSELEDIMRDKLENKLVEVKQRNGKITKHNLKMEAPSTMSNRLKQQIFFKKNGTTKNKKNVKLKNQIAKQENMNTFYA